MKGFARVAYGSLNARQKENYNFQKLSAVLAEYGFNCIRLSDDWHGADFIACHYKSADYLKVQLKTRLVFDKKYLGQELFIGFQDRGVDWYLYPHDELLLSMGIQKTIAGSRSWEIAGSYSWPSVPVRLKEELKEYRLS